MVYGHRIWRGLCRKVILVEKWGTDFTPVSTSTRAIEFSVWKQINTLNSYLIFNNLFINHAGIICRIQSSFERMVSMRQIKLHKIKLSVQFAEQFSMQHKGKEKN